MYIIIISINRLLFCNVNKMIFYFLMFPHRPTKMEAAVEKFMLSCAGYCVATYVLVSSLYSTLQAIDTNVVNCRA